MLAYHTPNTRSYVASADLSAKQNHFVKAHTVAGQVAAITSASDKPIGILMNTPLAGEAAEVAVLGGGAKLKVAGIIAAGARIKTDSAGKGVAASAEGDTMCAVADAIGASSADGDVIPVFPLPAIDLAPSAQAAVVAAVAGTLTGTVDGTIADVAAIALSTSDTYTDAAVNTAVNTAVTAVNLQLKELQTSLNAVIASLKTAGLMASA